MSRREELATKILLAFVGGPVMRDGAVSVGTLADYALAQADALLDRLYPQERAERDMDEKWRAGVKDGVYPMEANTLHAKRYADAMSARGEAGWQGAEGVRRAMEFIGTRLNRPWEWMPEFWSSSEPRRTFSWDSVPPRPVHRGDKFVEMYMTDPGPAP